MKAIVWANQQLKIIDQTLLPTKLKYITIETLKDAEDAIKTLKVRGAPALGIFAGFALLTILIHTKPKNTKDALKILLKSGEAIKKTRPTAVNLFWAIDRILRCAEMFTNEDLDSFIKSIEQEALAIYTEEIEACRQIGIVGNLLIGNPSTVLTHCNAGALATGEYGTALSPIYIASEEGKKVSVFSDETRPLLQGARLTAWELQYANIPVTLICDNMAGQVMKEKKIDLVIVGADRIAKNGDTANKIGTYSLSILAKHHGLPFYVAAPASTFDLSIANGTQIPIEQRNPDEICIFNGKRTAPKDISVYNPAFDVTPAENIAAFITEKGLIYPPFIENIPKILGID
ncbi:MAG TPA: S-methyl-5-thioribose-1-phosphate isomerase [Candidatus Hydrogenedens sp.]|nr:S-methyl-5-thioribose-1-phosphate isomerase [Candidatus Hydrogenedens sp.]